MSKYKFHAAANLFPMMAPDQFENFKEDIRRNGVQTPVVFLGKTNIVIDGRNTIKAVEEWAKEGVKIQLPVIRVKLDDGQVLGYVMSLNLHRRQLSSSQRAAVAFKGALLAKKYGYDLEPQRSASDEPDQHMYTAKRVGTNRDYMFRIQRIYAAKPEYVDAICLGSLRIPDAERLLRKRQPSVEQISLARQRLQQSRRDLRDLRSLQLVSSEAVSSVNAILAELNEKLQDAKRGHNRSKNQSSSRG